MPNPSYTYTLSNGTTADADQVMQNFNDILNGVTDGTKDMSVAALTVATTATLNGDVDLGNSSADTITFNGVIDSDIIPASDASYDFGSTSYGFASIYLGRNSQYVRIIPSASASASYTLTLPPAAGSSGQFLTSSDGSGTLGWTSGFGNWGNGYGKTNSVTNDDYTVTDTDGYAVILVSVGSANRTITLPTAADNTGRIITVKRTDDDPTYYLTVDGEGSETIDGQTTIVIISQYDYVTMVCDGTGWHILSKRLIDYIYNSEQTTADTGTSTVWGATGVTFTSAQTGARYCNIGGRYTVKDHHIVIPEFKGNSAGSQKWASVLGDPQAPYPYKQVSSSVEYGMDFYISSNIVYLTWGDAPAEGYTWANTETSGHQWRVKVIR